MRTFVIVAIVIAVLGGGAAVYWTQFRTAKDAAPAVTTAKVEVADLRAVVNSTGRVASNLDVDIKCKASGEIIELPVDVSQVVQAGDLLVVLDPVDEQRVVHEAQVQVRSAEARLAVAQRNLQIAESTLEQDRAKVQADLDAAAAHAKDARSKADRTKELFEKKLTSQEEYETAETSAVQAASDLTNARIKQAMLKIQEDGLELKRQDVKLAEASLESDRIQESVAQDRLKDTKVVAPMDGVVSVRNVQKGQIISSGISNVGGGTTVLTLSDLSQIFVYASVDESDIGRVQLGQSVDITADAFAGRRFRGVVSRIATKGTNTSNVVTFEVQIRVLSDERGGRRGERSARAGLDQGAQRTRRGTAGPEGSASDPATAASQPASTSAQRRFILRPEMTANVEIVVGQADAAMSVPVEAVFRKGGKTLVTVRAGGAQTDVEVVAGINDGTKIHIVSGLKEGQEVLVRQAMSQSRWNSQRGPGGGMPFMGGGGRGGRGR